MEQFEQAKNVAVYWCGEAKGAISDYMEKPVFRTRKQTLIAGFCLFLVGIVVGFLISPVKKGISICSNNVDSFSSNEAHDNHGVSSENKKKRR